MLAFGSVLGVQAQAQSFSDYEWKNEMAVVKEIPAEFQKADAVIINNETYSRGVFSGTFPYIEQLATYRTQAHVKIQSEEALEDYKRIIVQKFEGQIADYVQYKTVDVRVRKKDGKVIDYNVRELKRPELTEEDDLYENRDRLFIYEIPDLAVGDEIETINIIESKFLDQGRIVNLYGQYPTLKSSYSISVPLKVQLKGSIYNNMPTPKVATTSTNRVYSWEMENLRAVPEANSAGTIFTKDLEYFVYELNFDAFRADALSFSVQNWSDLMWQYSEDFLKVRVRKKKKLEAFYEELFAQGAKAFGKTPDKLAGIEKLYLLNDFVAKKLQIVNKLEDFEKSEGIEYFLVNGKSDYRNMMRIYRDAFERFGVEYYLAVAKNRFDGPMDMTFVSNTQVNGYFFIFKNGEGFSAISGTGAWGELPWSFANTKILMKDLSDRKSELKEINFQDADLVSENNKRFSRSQVQINLEGNTITQKVSNSYSGMYARGARGRIIAASKPDTLDKAMTASFENIFEGKDNVEFNVKGAKVQKFMTTPPYDFKYGYTLTVTNLMKQKEGKYSIKGEELLGHNIRWVTNAENRQLDYHVPFLGTDTEELYLVFNKNVELENAAELTQKVDNEYASYEMNVTQMKPNMIRIQSIYQTKKLFIPKEDVMKLNMANEAFEKVSDAKFVFKPVK